MLLHYFYKKENKEKNQVNDIYSKIIKLSIKFTQSNKFILKKDFHTSFEVFSIFLIIYIKSFKDFKINNFEKINEKLIDLFIKDLDHSFREIGIGDMKIGKYVKTYVKKFYFRLNNMDDIFDALSMSKLAEFITKLNFLNKEHITIFSEEIFNMYLKIQSSVKNNSNLDSI